MALCSLSGCVYFVSCFAIFLILVACCRKLLNAKGMMSVLSQVTAAARWQWYDITGINPAATRWQWYDTTGINGQRFMDLGKGSWIAFGSAVNSTYLSVLDLVSLVPTIFQCLPISKKQTDSAVLWLLVHHISLIGRTRRVLISQTYGPKLHSSPRPWPNQRTSSALPDSHLWGLGADAAPHLSVHEASLRHYRHRSPSLCTRGFPPT